MTSSGASPGERWRVVVDSIGTARANLIGALSEVSLLPPAQLAARLYRAPSELWTGLDRNTADQVNSMLVAAGLDSRVLAEGESFAPGDANHEVAIFVPDMARIADVARAVLETLGVDARTARQILCSSPTVLLGQISHSTASALRERFEALGVEVDVSRADQARFDVFLGACTPADRDRAIRSLDGLNLAITTEPDQPILATGLSRADADQVWERLGRFSLPVRILNRDFQRFSVVLEQASQSQKFIDWLVACTGMPAAVAPKVIDRVPIVLHHSVPAVRMAELLTEATALGARASAHLLAFQSFALKLEKLGDRAQASRTISALAGLDTKAALGAIQCGRIEGPLTDPQARWLEYELRQSGTDSERQLR